MTTGSGEAELEAGLIVDALAPGVTRLALNRPRVRNALDLEAVRSLIEAVTCLVDPVAVLTSTHEGMFCAGADLSVADSERALVSDLLYELYEKMVSSPVVIIAAVDGPAVGGGAQLLLASDVRMASPAARIRFAGPGHGLAVGTWGLPSLIGRGGALDAMLTMRTIAAEEAHSMGLVDRLVSAADLRSSAVELAEAIAGLDRAAAVRVKRLVVEGTGLRDRLVAERQANGGWAGAVPPPGLTPGAAATDV